MKDQIHLIGRISIFVYRVFRTLFYTRGNLRAIMDQTAFVSIRSLGTIVAAGAFVGAILVLQFNLMLTKYDAQSLLGGLNTSAIIREIGPLLISFLLAGKIGAYTAAELATMRVTEQIEAIECLGTDPLQFIVVPRFFAIIFSSMIVLCIGLTVSVAGSMVLAQCMYGINFLSFASSIPRFTDPWTFFGGFFKSLVYSFIVAGVCCYQGYNASGGAKGVGRAVTHAAIYTNFYIVIANFTASHFVDVLREFWESFS
jgi:phospholipid/cholesterol/gamma-HCH transport system permease protein